MTTNTLKNRAEAFIKSNSTDQQTALELYREVIHNLENGSLRVAEKNNRHWVINHWIKAVILLGFKYGHLMEIPSYSNYNYYDKDTILPKKISLNDRIRLVPGGSSIRCGTYVSPGTIIMPPTYVNIGAYIDVGCMLDSNVLIGSCAQLGKNIHVSAGTQIGGVLEPINAAPVIIEDDVFIGGNAGIYEGTIVSQGAVIGTGVVLNRSTPIFDNVKNCFIKSGDSQNLVVPPQAVVIPGSRPISGVGQEHQIHTYCPVIIKYRNHKTDQATSLEELLRSDN